MSTCDATRRRLDDQAALEREFERREAERKNSRQAGASTAHDRGGEENIQDTPRRADG
jgi:hypothetical protein